MPATLTYPGVYIEEIPSGVRTIVGVATSITAFVGRTARGPTDDPVVLTSFGDYERTFGGLHADSPVSFAVRDFYLNGGSQAVVVRLFADDVPAVVGKSSKAALVLGSKIDLEAAAPGSWGQHLRGEIDFNVSADAIKAAGLDATPWRLFNVTVRDDQPGGAVETFRLVTTEDKPRRIDRVLTDESDLVQWKGTFPTDAKDINAELKASQEAIAKAIDAVDKAANETAAAVGREALADVRVDSGLRDGVSKMAALSAKSARALAVVLANPKSTDSDKDKARKDATAAEGEVDKAKKARQAVATDGGVPAFADYLPAGGSDKKTGLFALDKLDLFNLLCLPSFADPISDVLAQAAAYCQKRRAFLLIDAPAAWQKDGRFADLLKKDPRPLRNDLGVASSVRQNAAVYFPRVKYPNPTHGDAVEEFPPCGVIAGLYAATDTARGVWKAPAGVDAALQGVSELSVRMTDLENGLLNPVGINCLRAFPAAGKVVWGSRTLKGDDQTPDDYKYVPVRRLALFIEESLYRGTQWAVFEPNDEPLWAQLRVNIGAFMNDLFRQGAFAGSSPTQAYRVKCDSETTPQSDVNKGIVNVLVGFAPLKPAEFVVLKIQQLAGQLDS